MTTEQELPVQQKRELQSKEESTVPVRIFVPVTDIYETEEGLTVTMEMPGVDKANVEIDVKDGVLTVQGRLDFAKYEELKPVYTEYNIGNYRRSFSISNKINQERISAEMNDGVLRLSLPKAEEARPRRIAVA
jgi:HSP20 family molecular chaperone IbpA